MTNGTCAANEQPKNSAVLLNTPDAFQYDNFALFLKQKNA